MGILLFFLAGAITGFLIRKRATLVKGANLGTYGLLGLLIFVMGASTGSRPDVLVSFSKLGLASVVLAIGGILGSIIFLVPFLQKKMEKQE